jgi:hypothetical protein
MNEMEELEMQLRSWVPRRPSARLERRLFGPRPAPHKPAFGFRWLAPVTAAFVVLCVLMTQHNGPSNSLATPSNTMVAAALSNQLAAGWLSGSLAREQNALPTETFEWTNGNGWSSSNGPLRGPRGTD